MIRAAVVAVGLALLALGGACRPAPAPTSPPASADEWPTFEALTAGMKGEVFKEEGQLIWQGYGVQLTYKTTERTIIFIWRPDTDRLLDADYLTPSQQNLAAFFSAMYPGWQGAGSTFGFLTTSLQQTMALHYNHTITEVLPGNFIWLTVKWIDQPMP